MEEFGQYGEAPKPLYVALIGDVVGSRQVTRRADLQTQLRDKLDALNRRLADTLVSRLMLIRGDEIQGLFRRPDAAVEIVVDLAEGLPDVQLVYGLGYGPITTGLIGEVTEIDGPCFHGARRALDAAKKAGAWVATDGFPHPADRVLAALFQLMQAVRSRWTKRQAQFAQAARSSLQKEVAKRFGVFPSVVSESLKAASFATIREGEEAARAVLLEFAELGELAAGSASEPNR